jgi:hypothetical protein
MYNLILKPSVNTGIAASPASRTVRKDLPVKTDNLTWAIFNLSGQSVRQGLGSTHLRVLPQGVYVLKSMDAWTHEVRHQKFLVR